MSKKFWNYELMEGELKRLVYDRNRIFGRNIRPNIRPPIKQPKFGKILLFFNLVIRIQSILINCFGISLFKLISNQRYNIQGIFS